MSSRGAPRPKRAGDDFTRYHTHESESSSKKPRFDARNPSTLVPDAPDDEDAILDLDEIGKSAQTTKRNAVNIDGFESDSSTDNFDARAAMKAKRAEKSKDEDDNDMFADLEEDFADEDAATKDKGKKEVRFLEADEIEGQVASSKSGGHVAADFSLNGKGRARDADVEESSSESGSDEERDRLGNDVDEELGAGSKKKHAPKLDAFNMREEGEEGRFDESGNYVRKAVDPDAKHDTWLEGLSKKDMRKAKEAQDKRDEERRLKEAEQDAMLTSDLLDTLLSRLEKGETVLEALQRLGKGKSKPKPKWQKNKRRASDAMDVDADKEPEDPKEVQRKEQVEAITGAADQLLTRGEDEIYDTEREMLLRQYRRETGEDWKEPSRPEGGNGVAAAADVKQWEYRWSDARDGGEHHGPYAGHTMTAWSDAGYFGEGVEFRQIGDGEWSRSVDFA